MLLFKPDLPTTILCLFYMTRNLHKHRVLEDRNGLNVLCLCPRRPDPCTCTYLLIHTIPILVRDGCKLCCSPLDKEPKTLGTREIIAILSLKVQYLVDRSRFILFKVSYDHSLCYRPSLTKQLYTQFQPFSSVYFLRREI